MEIEMETSKRKRAIRECKVEQVFTVLKTGTQLGYFGEQVTQLDHALQCAKFARDSGADDECVLGALFHDIGHLLDQNQDHERMGDLGIVKHEDYGAKYLEDLGFSSKVQELVRQHVNAKRYLIWKNPKLYYKKLSEASKATLIYQGGGMNDQEAERFEAIPYFEDVMKMRNWDDKGKIVGMKNVPSLESYREIAVNNNQSNLNS